MRDLWRIALKLLNRNRKMTWFIRIQFLVMLLLVLALLSFLFKNQDQMNVLREQIGQDVWMIKPTHRYTSNSGQTNWTKDQLNLLEEKFTSKVGVISFSPNQDGDTQKVYVNDVIKKLISNHNQKRMVELLQHFLIYDPIQPNAQILPLDAKHQEDLWIYVVGVEDAEIYVNALDAELSALNSSSSYDVRQVISIKEQKTEVNLIYAKSLLFFITISFMLIMICIISFVLLQNQYQIAKLQLFRLFGATRMDIIKIYVFINLLLLGPSYMIALLLFILVGVLWIPFTAWMLTFLISFCLVVVLLLLMTIPSLSLGR